MVAAAISSVRKVRPAMVFEAASGAVATALSQSQVELVWSAATDNVLVSAYQVYLSFGAGNTTYILAGEPTTATTIIANVPPNTLINFVVKAIDSSNNFSAANSNVATVTTTSFIDLERPSDMADLREVAAFTNSALIGWTQGTDNLGSVLSIIEQCTGAACTDFAVVATNISLTTLSRALSPNTTYRFRGKHSDGAGNVSLNYSNIINVTTKAAATGALTQPRAPVPFSQPRLPRTP